MKVAIDICGRAGLNAIDDSKPELDGVGLKRDRRQRSAC